MQNELCESIVRWSSVFSCLRATAMAASSALLILLRFGCDLMSLCVLMSVFGLLTPAPSGEVAFTCELSVYTQSLRFHFLLWGLSIGLKCCCCCMWVYW